MQTMQTVELETLLFMIICQMVMFVDAAGVAKTLALRQRGKPAPREVCLIYACIMRSH